MKLKYKFIKNKVADKIVAVAVGDDLAKFNGFIKMNDTGSQIFDLLENDITEEEILEKMQALYPDESPETVKECVETFLAKLKESDVL